VQLDITLTCQQFQDQVQIVCMLLICLHRSSKDRHLYINI